MSHVASYILVSRKSDKSDDDFNAALAKHGHNSVGLLHDDLRVHKVHVPAGKEQEAVDQLSLEPSVEFAELDEYVDTLLVLNDPNIAAYHLTKIGAPTAWDTCNGTGVTVAVVDGGVQSNHPDLAANIVAGYNVWDSNTTTTDVTGHGTAVAGVIAAVGNNSIGSAGVAYGSKIMPIRATDALGNGTFASATNAIMKASDLGAHVVNISWANLYKSSTVIQAAASFRTARNGIVVVSANNNAIDEATASVPLLVVVSGTQSDDTFWPTSSWGQMVDCCAPAVSVPTTLWNSAYGAGTGTSFATPIVSGVIALIKSARPDYTPEQVLDCLVSNCADLGGAGYDTKFGYGRVSASASIAATIAAPAPDATPPVVAITAPAAAATVTGTVGVRVTATDNVGVTKVEFKVAGVVVDTTSILPYIFSWDTTSSANGAVALTAKAYDAAGNSATSASVSVTVSNSAPGDTTAPVVAILTPANNAHVSGNVRITTSASDLNTITQKLYIDNVLKTTVVGAAIAYSWNTKKVLKGSHAIKVTATDVAGNVGTATITVTV
jgi:thermitase